MQLAVTCADCMHVYFKAARIDTKLLVYVQVGDFNLSRTAGSALTNSNLSANNPRWLAPEVITHQVRLSTWLHNAIGHSEKSSQLKQHDRVLAMPWS